LTPITANRQQTAEQQGKHQKSITIRHSSPPVDLKAIPNILCFRSTGALNLVENNECRGNPEY
jgi:hypothetical protein